MAPRRCKLLRNTLFLTFPPFACPLPHPSSSYSCVLVRFRGILGLIYHRSTRFPILVARIERTARGGAGRRAAMCDLCFNEFLAQRTGTNLRLDTIEINHLACVCGEGGGSDDRG